MFIPDVLSEERTALQEVTRGLLRKRSPESRVRAVVDSEAGYDAELWRAMATELDLVGLLVPEVYGGSNAGVHEMVVVQGELGRSLAPTPFLSSACFATSLLLALGDEGACAGLLPAITEGSTIAAVAVCGPSGDWQMGDSSVSASVDGDQWVLDGERWYVLDGVAADVVLVPVRTANGLSVFAVETSVEGLECISLRTLDLTRRQAVLRFTQTPARLVGAEGMADQAYSTAVRIAMLALVAEQAGAAEFLLEMALDYAKTRHQFGRAIGSFQAIKHKLAEMAFDLERMKSAVARFADAVSEDAPDAGVVAHLSKGFCSEAFYRIAAENIQVHGGIGFTWEHPAHLYFRRAKSTESILGTPHQHREKMLESLGFGEN